MTGRRNGHRGFSLIELAIAIVIVGLMIGVWSQANRITKRAEAISKLPGLMNMINQAILQYQLEHGYYPCPADPTLPKTDSRYGRSDCGYATSVPRNKCYATGVLAPNGLCHPDGSRDADGDGFVDGVLLGILPFRDMKINDVQQFGRSDAFDMWGYYYTYGVTENLTKSPFDPTKGVIAVNSKNIVDQPPPPDGHIDGAQFVIVSHGRDGKGAYTSQGQIHAPCAVGTGLDFENCNNDSTFLKAFGGDRAYPESLKPGANYYDDFIQHIPFPRTPLWKASVNDPNNVNNTNTGSIGIGTQSPLAKLDVAGNMRAQTIHAPKICDLLGNNCFDPALIGGNLPTAIQCGPNQAVKGIVNGQAVCADLVMPNITPGDCPAGPPQEYIIGIKPDLTIICGP